MVALYAYASWMHMHARFIQVLPVKLTSPSYVMVHAHITAASTANTMMAMMHADDDRNLYSAFIHENLSFLIVYRHGSDWMQCEQVEIVSKLGAGHDNLCMQSCSHDACMFIIVCMMLIVYLQLCIPVFNAFLSASVIETPYFKAVLIQMVEYSQV